MKYELFNIIFLTLIIIGAITFISSMVFWNEPLLILSLFQMANGSLGLYMIRK